MTSLRTFRSRLLHGLLLVLGGLVLCPALAQAQPHVLNTPPLAPEEQQKKFRLPPGFAIQLVAAEPQVRKPINLNFDDQGRLLVTGSVEYPYAAKPGVKPRDTLVRLEDKDGDGRADEVTTYVDELNIPIGVAAIRGGAIVFSIPNILRVTDTDGDGRPDKREVIYSTFGQDDTHGLSSSYQAWVDGWIYGCHGFRNNSVVKGSDGQAIEMNSGNTYRMRPDGSRIEYYSHGQVNPFGMCIDPLGNVFTSDCHTKPVYQILRGAWYPSFGKPADGLGYGPEICKHSHGSTGIAGVVYYAADHFPPEYRDTLFIGNPITARVNHDKARRHGSTYEAVEQPDFLICDDPWFRPVDVRMGPDGALYVADFYNRIIGHYEVPLDHPGRDRERGRVWRITYEGPDKQAPKPRRMPDLEKAAPGELIALLGDANLLVRVKATNQLVERIGKPAAELAAAKLSGESAPQRAHALWVVERLGGLSPEQIQALSADSDPLVRTHLRLALAERREWSAPAIADLFRKGLADSDAFVQRVSADGLARHPASENIEPLLDLWAKAPKDDTMLIHTLRMALRDQLLVPSVVESLAKAAADGPLDPARQARLGRLGDVSIGAQTPAAAKLLLVLLGRGAVFNHRVEDSMHHAGRYLAAEELSALETLALSYSESKPADQQRQVIRGVYRSHQERGVKVPDRVTAWARTLAAKLLGESGEGAVRQGIELARELKLKDALAGVSAVASDANSKFPGLRPVAIDAAVAIDGTASIPVLAEILSRPGEGLALRQKAASALGTIPTDQARAELARQLRTAPEPVAVAIGASLAANKSGAELLLAAVAEGKASPRLLLERTVVEPLRKSQPADLDAKLAKLTAGLPPADQRIKQLIQDRRTGFEKTTPDLALGAKAFERVCAKCHQIEGKGAKIGPQLEGLGHRGLERVLEDLLDPSRNIDGAFRTTQIVTTEGRILSGLLLRTDGEVLVMADAEGKEVRIPKKEIDQQVHTNLSPMPANVTELVPEGEFYHLIGFLLSQKQAPVKPEEKK